MIAIIDYYYLFAYLPCLSSICLTFRLFISNETCKRTGSEQPNRTLNSSTVEHLKEKNYK